MALVLLAGCTAKQEGTATPTPGTGGDTSTRTTGSTGSPSGTNNSPKIDAPLDATRFLSQPCAVLSPTQLQAFNISNPGTPHTDDPTARSTGPYCNWSSDDPVPRGISVGFLVSNKNGLADTIRGGRAAFPGYFEPAEVDGYPAVFNDLVDGRSRGICNITVGISNTLAFRAAESWDRKRGTQSCEGAKQIAAAVITSLKGE
ncbi:MAG TPA: DUF3558 domain-containing protein [Actinophytocola sp.]|uniref:DUF3558 domain-containing protein n=1 Tax=Actinophytocola sp. TaxID=1872138 RepID=UPI002DB84A9A|nr:DUF3558 domain-containing protein [Actinophytocola sp.]HEU5472185.1 DUF3558 domain-containing protein [Actinophytocola sp.]